MEWIVVTVIIALVGLFLTVGTPIIRLNKNIVTLNVNLEHYRKELAEQKQALKEQRESAKESHSKLWVKNSEQDKQLADHELRLKMAESKIEGITNNQP